MEESIDCKSEEGILTGLIDSILTSATVAANKLRLIDPDDVPRSVLEACSDLFQDKDLRLLISFGGNRTYTDLDNPDEFMKLLRAMTSDINKRFEELATREKALKLALKL